MLFTATTRLQILREGSLLSYGESESLVFEELGSNICQLTFCFLSIVKDKTPLPPPASTPEEDDALFEEDAYVESPVRIDYGTNLRYDASSRKYTPLLILHTALGPMYSSTSMPLS